MNRFIKIGGKGASFSSGGLLVPFMILVGLVILVLFFIVAFALAVILVPVGVVLFLLRKVFFPGKKTAIEPEMETQKENFDSEIIDVTDYKRVDEEKKELKA